MSWKKWIYYCLRVLLLSRVFIYISTTKKINLVEKKKKIDKEIEEAVKNVNYGKFTKKQFVGFEK